MPPLITGLPTDLDQLISVTCRCILRCLFTKITLSPLPPSLSGALSGHWLPRSPGSAHLCHLRVSWCSLWSEAHPRTWITSSPLFAGASGVLSAHWLAHSPRSACLHSLLMHLAPHLVTFLLIYISSSPPAGASGDPFYH